ncbi:maker625, partial [Drosophila busckii]
FQAPCHTTFEPIKGWTVIQRRFNGSVSFDRKWDEYKNGFGDLRGEYWLGLEKLHLMTKFQPHELYIELENREGEILIESWSNFSIGNESESYTILSLGKYTGNAHFRIYHGHDIFGTNIKFLTKDRDNNNQTSVWYNCADVYESGWWYGDHCIGW